ncbi:hypothetical protein AUR64_00820 [Haloprofundus marisrubri]|uniref:Uncharacterized protein n=1 Tax=Haloprofundus marisrubri TaxID=1514971 RepID=A0A0W1R4K1_9EURY|nr:hypothetical protein [Haloprofundus marisrubri]KTG08151.1 hypothetical protein AUR64_00820 [Haloprofundus marisrubri]
MNQYEDTRRVGDDSSRRWIRMSGIAASVAGVIFAAVGAALLTLLNPAEFEVVGPFGIVASIVLAAALVPLYASERQWFGRLAKAGFGLLAVGSAVAAVALPIADYWIGIAFLAYLAGLLVLFVGAIVYGVAMLRADAPPRTAAWLLIAALPIGLPGAIAIMQLTAGEVLDPWGGSMILYGLAWVFLGRHLWTTTERTVATPADTGA